MNRMLAILLSATFVALTSAAGPAHSLAPEASASIVVDPSGNAVAPTPEALPRDPESTTRRGLYATPEQAYRTKLHFGASVLLIDVRSVDGPRHTGAQHREATLAVPHLRIPYLSGSDRSAIAPFLRSVGSVVTELPRGKGTPILLICENGRLAAAAAETLTDAGYTNVIVVTGGIDGEIEGDRRGWLARKLPANVSHATTGAPMPRHGFGSIGGPSASLPAQPYL